MELIFKALPTDLSDEGGVYYCTILAFKSYLSWGLSPEDGTGYYATSVEESNVEVFPLKDTPSWATHVCWYRK